MAKGKTIINDDRSKALKQYLEYRDKFLELDISVWSKDHMDHLRLPANIDITEFLIYMKFRFYEWLGEIGYKGEKPIFDPAFSDRVLSLEDSNVAINQDSPHTKIPWSISYKIKRKVPMSRTPPFGRDKLWKFKYCGYFKDDEDGKIYEIRMKQWESLVEFIIASRSNLQVDTLTSVFENFVNINQRYFQVAGLERLLPLGRIDESEKKLEDVGLHYRKLQYWAPTQEFFVAGPFERIRNVDINVDINEF